MFADNTYIRPSGSNKYLVKVETDFHILLPNKMLPNNNVKEVIYHDNECKNMEKKQGLENTEEGAKGSQRDAEEL